MRAPAELDDSNRGHCSPPDPLLSNFVIQSTTYFAPPATQQLIAAQQAFRPKSPAPAPCIVS